MHAHCKVFPEPGKKTEGFLATRAPPNQPFGGVVYHVVNTWE